VKNNFLKNWYGIKNAGIQKCYKYRYRSKTNPAISRIRIRYTILP